MSKFFSHVKFAMAAGANRFELVLVMRDSLFPTEQTTYRFSCEAREGADPRGPLGKMFLEAGRTLELHHGFDLVPDPAKGDNE